VYSADPKSDPGAVKYDTLSFGRIVDEKLGVIDLAASVLCMENKMPMLVFGLNEENSVINAVHGNSSGTIITP
ncbi:MAG: UMP kinase, partial [Lachnospiraceae bacterium]|nr:UMP kinase [Lachnospiraceae bacterium]